MMRPGGRRGIPRVVCPTGTRFLLACTAGLACTACGDNLPDPLEGTSGSRLAILRDVFEDGTQLAERGTFFDQARGERCSPRRWSDGATYCTPVTEDLVYSDLGCMTGLGRVAAGTTPPYFARYFHLAGVASISRVYAPGAPLAAPASYWIQQGNTCEGPFAGDPADDFYALGEELDSAAFARVRRLEAAGTARLGIVRQTGDDGLRIPVGFRDRTLGAECLLPDHHDTGSVPCAPDGAPLASYFHDAACTEPAVSLAGSEIPSLAARTSEVSGCTSYATLAGEVTPDPLYLLAGTTCLQVAHPDGERQFLLGAAVEPAVVQRVREDRAGARVRRVRLVGDDATLLDDLVFDGTIGGDCRVVDAGATGEALRCLPASTAEVRPLFADDACQVPIDLALVPNGSCDPPSPFGARATAPGDALELHAVGPPFTGPIFEISTGDRCVPYLPPARLTPHEVGPALPLDTFAAVTATIDP